MVDKLLRSDVYISPSQGEFLLSRAVNEISVEHSAHVVLVGTYAAGNDNVFVTAKLIRASDSVILASHDYVLPYIRDMRMLLRDRVADAADESVAVPAAEALESASPYFGLPTPTN